MSRDPTVLSPRDTRDPAMDNTRGIKAIRSPSTREMRTEIKEHRHEPSATFTMTLSKTWTSVRSESTKVRAPTMAFQKEGQLPNSQLDGVHIQLRSGQ